MRFGTQPFSAPPSDRGSEHWPVTLPAEVDRSIEDIDTPLLQRV